MSARLSVVMIAKNAADLLPDCLASVTWADEIVLLDSGSTDATVEVARAAGVQVYSNSDWQVMAFSASEHNSSLPAIMC